MFIYHKTHATVGRKKREKPSKSSLLLPRRSHLWRRHVVPFVQFHVARFHLSADKTDWHGHVQNTAGSDRIYVGLTRRSSTCDSRHGSVQWSIQPKQRKQHKPSTLHIPPLAKHTSPIHLDTTFKFLENPTPWVTQNTRISTRTAVRWALHFFMIFISSIGCTSFSFSFPKGKLVVFTSILACSVDVNRRRRFLHRCCFAAAFLFSFAGKYNRCFRIKFARVASLKSTDNQIWG